MTKPFRISVISFALLLLPVGLQAGTEGEFFATSNQSPLVQIYGLPSLAGPRLLKDRELQVSANAEISNHFFNTSANGELLTLDGETQRIALVVKGGTGNFEWGVELPHLRHTGGSLDNFIENWHNTFGMPNGGRDQVPRNQLTYLYQRNGIERFRYTTVSDGIGDVRMYGALPAFVGASSTDTALRAALKLPTGDSGELRGSGAADLAVWLVTGCKRSACPPEVQWTLAGGLLGMGRGDVLTDQQRRLVAFGGAGVGWRALQTIVLKAELFAHTPFYKNSNLKPLDANAIQLVLGTGWEVTADTVVEVAVAEDINVDSAPDVTFLISLRSTFRR